MTFFKICHFLSKALSVLSIDKTNQPIFVSFAGQEYLCLIPNILFCFQNALYLQHNRNKIEK